MAKVFLAKYPNPKLKGVFWLHNLLRKMHRFCPAHMPVLSSATVSGSVALCDGCDSTHSRDTWPRKGLNIDSH